jgi:hypothetical protein
MKQVAYPKGMHNGSEANSTPFLVRYAFNGTQVGQLPMPSLPQDSEVRQLLARFAGDIDRLQIQRRAIDFVSVLSACDPSSVEMLSQAVRDALSLREGHLHQAIALQEEIDWLVYKLFGLTSLEPLVKTYRLRPGERPFEIRLAQDDPTSITTGWFRWSEISPFKVIPRDLGEDIIRTLEERIDAIRASKHLRMLESPENKRRWRQPAGKAAQELETDEKVFRDQSAEWLIDRLEEIVKSLIARAPYPVVVSVRDVVRQVLQDGRFLCTLEWLHSNSDVSAFVADQLARESIPFLAGYRYSPSGRDRHDQWRAVWDYQRLADLLEAELPRFRSASEAASAAAREAGTRLTVERSKLASASYSLTPSDPAPAPRRRGRKPEAVEPASTDDGTPKPPALLAAEDAEAAARAAQNAARLDLEEAEAFHRKARAFIPVPQKYEPSDFRDPAYFRLRGKLDVPRERFIAYPGAASDNDPTPVYGWAGWTHLERALALLQLYYERKLQENWQPARLVPLLAGLQELLPWVAQWHGDEVHPDTGERYVDAFETHITAGCTGLGVSRAQLVDWTPPGTHPARAPRTATSEDDAPPKRRPRSADPVPDVSSDAPPKSRGRPPKSEATPGDMSEAPAAPKRRGRPPKSASE